MDPDFRLSLGLTLLKKLCAQKKENFVFSPLSIGTAFAMLSAGLKNDTKSEVHSFLGCKDEERMHSAFSELIFSKDSPLKMANKYLADHRVKIYDDYNTLLKSRYESEVECVNFVSDAPKIEAQVNEWVAGKTNQMINELLKPGTLTPDTVLVLLNAIYFKGTWLNEFDRVQSPMLFRLRDGTKIEKTFMKLKSRDFGYHETDTLRFVRVPYKECGFYMVMAIPQDESKHIDDVVPNLTVQELHDALGALKSYSGLEVNLKMPKFKIDYKYADLVDNLKYAGVQKIFVPGLGDFGGIFEKVGDEVYVSDVLHQAVIEVDEKGTKAAAATAVAIMARCSMGGPRPRCEFIADRAFFFAICTEQDIVSFAGVCQHPDQ